MPHRSRIQGLRAGVARACGVAGFGPWNPALRRISGGSGQSRPLLQERQMQYSLFERSYNWPVGTLLVQSAAGLELASADLVLAEARRLADSIPKGPLLEVLAQ